MKFVTHKCIRFVSNLSSHFFSLHVTYQKGKYFNIRREKKTLHAFILVLLMNVLLLYDSPLLPSLSPSIPSPNILYDFIFFFLLLCHRHVYTARDAIAIIEHQTRLALRAFSRKKKKKNSVICCHCSFRHFIQFSFSFLLSFPVGIEKNFFFHG